jgi:acetyl esterase/lipase
MDTIELKLNIYYQDGAKPSKPVSAIVFFFGGGWEKGDPSHFSGQCEYLASRGITAIAADYRTKERHGTSPIECIEDAKSAMRWIRMNAKTLMIDPDRIVASGGSAGGHLAASCAIITDFNDPSDDLAISCIPNALVLFNPVLNIYDNAALRDRFLQYALDASPMHHLKPGLAPTLIFHGSADKIVPILEVQNFTDKVLKNGDECKLMVFEGKEHGFFNTRGDNTADFWKTLLETEKFLINRQFLENPIPNIETE